MEKMNLNRMTSGLRITNNTDQHTGMASMKKQFFFSFKLIIFLYLSFNIKKKNVKPAKNI